MQHFYDGQIRRYLAQTIRVLSNFVVKYGDGTLVRVPVMYGDQDKQAASIIRNNSENSINSVPRIAIYVSGLDLDKDRLSDSSYVGKVHIRERDINGGVYTTGQGRNYTVERLMPTPFKLTIKCDIWTANTDQKLQVLEQILVLFNPSLELQTTDNYLDWTSLSVLNLVGTTWSSRTVPVGTQDAIDIATLTFETPIWISPPAKVKHLGVITKIITSLYDGGQTIDNTYIDGLGQPLVGPETSLNALLDRKVVTITDYKIQVYGGRAILLAKSESSIPREPALDIPVRQGTAINWQEVFDQYPSKYVAGSSTLYLTQPNGSEVVGTVAIDPMDPTVLIVNWDQDTYPQDTLIDSSGFHLGDAGFDQTTARGTFDAIIDPQKVYPGQGMTNVVAGDRFLIVEDIGNIANEDGPDAWKSTNGDDFYAHANDIIEWDGTQWSIVFDSAQEEDTLIWQTNIYKSQATIRVQYTWNGVQWAKSFEGEYEAGVWRVEL
jgi:T4-like virus Myoviridae tail sheath stabiliser